MEDAESDGEGQNSDLIQELSCTLCLELFYEPTTLRCGHTFCMSCIKKSIIHKNECPICREVVTHIPSSSVTLRNICNHHFPKQYEARRADFQQLLEEKPPSRLLPMFILEPLLPNQEMTLHVFEYRYRSMISRCLESDMLFGMRDRNDTNFAVEVRITRYVPLPDGRSIVTIKSLRRIEIEELTTHAEGYAEARVVDVRDTDSNNREELATLRETITEKLVDWIENAKRKRGDSRVSQIITALGPPPEDFEDHSFWLAALLNPLPYLSLCHEIRVKALALKDTKQRYELILETLEGSLKYMNQPFIGSRAMTDWITYFVVCALTISIIYVLGGIFQERNIIQILPTYVTSFFVDGNETVADAVLETAS